MKRHANRVNALSLKRNIRSLEVDVSREHQEIVISEPSVLGGVHLARVFYRQRLYQL